MRTFTPSAAVLILACLGYTGRAVAQFTVIPLDVNFQGSPGASVPPQTVTIGGTSGAVITVTESYGASNPAGWFNVSAATVLAGGTVTVSLPSTANLPSGTTGSITFTENGTSNQVTVLVTYTATGTGSGTFTLMPSSIGDNFTSSLLPQTTTVAINGASSTATFIFDTMDGTVSGWLSAAGATQNTFTVTVAPLNLPPGTTSGSVIVTQSGTTNSVILPVSAKVGAGQYSASPDPLSFTVPGFSTILSDQVVTITGPINAQVSATASVNSGGYPWMILPSGLVTLGGGTGTLAVTVDPVGLPPSGTFTGDILVYDQGGSVVLTVPVTVTTSGTPTLKFTQTQLNFAYEIGKTPPLPQIVGVTSTSGSVPFTATATSNCSGAVTINGGTVPITWTANNTTPVAFTVAVNTTALPSITTTCSGNIQLTAPGATNPTTNLPVNLLVSTTPVIQVLPSAFTIYYQPGGAPLGSWAVDVTSSDSTQSLPVTYSVTSGSAGKLVDVVQTPGAFLIALDSVVAAALAVGSYENDIAIIANAAGNPSIELPVTVNVVPSPTLVVTPGQVTFSYQIGQNLPAPQTLTLSSTGAPITFTPSEYSATCGSWLSVSPANTDLSTLTASGQNGTRVTLTANVDGLKTPETCLAHLFFVDVGGNVHGVDVQLNVVNKAVINVGVNNITATAAPGSNTPINVNVPVTSSDNATSIVWGSNVYDFSSQEWISFSGSNTGSTPGNVNLQLNPTNLPYNQYFGGVTITDNTPNSPVPIQYVLVSLTVANQFMATPTSLAYTQALGGAGPPGQTVQITSTAPGLGYSVSPSTTSGGNWLTVSSASGTTPATVSVSVVNDGALAAGTYTGAVTFLGSAAGSSPLSVPVTLTIAGSSTLGVSPTSLTFTGVAGQPEPIASKSFTVSSTGANFGFIDSASTTSGGNWLTVSSASGTTPATVSVTANATGLGAGTYPGTVTVSSPGAGNSPVNIPVTLIIGGPLAITGPAAGALPSGTVGLPYTSTTITAAGGTAPYTFSATGLPTGLSIGSPTGTISGTPTTAGSYTVGATVTDSAGATATESYALTIASASGPTPSLTSIANAASGVAGAVSPGEIISIFGTNIGPSTPANFQLTSAGTVPTTLATTQVFFDGQPAPLLYVSATQINAIVPYEINGRTQTAVTVSSYGTPSSPLTLSVAGSAPAIFTLTQNGSGQAAALNPYGTVISATNPAAPGSVITVFGTGGGQTNPPSTTGSVTPIPTSPSGLLAIPGVTVTIGGQPATVTFAGAAPGLVSGVFQVDFICPDVPSGTQPIGLAVGDYLGQGSYLPIQ